MDNEFGDKTQPSLKSKFVDVRIVLTDLEYIEPISRAVSNFDLSNFNVIVSSIIPTNDVELAKTAVNGADLILIAIESSEGDELFNAFKKELKTPYNFIEPLNLPSLERLNSYEDNVFEDEIANSIIRGGLFSISSLSAINNAKRQYFNLKDEYNRNLLKIDKLNEENKHLIEESKYLRDKNEKLSENIKILQKDLDTIKSDFSDYKSRLESMYVRNSLEVFPIVDLWNELFSEGFNENIYKFILLVTDNFRPQNIMIGQGIICAENKDEALDWLKVIKTASILVDENINDLNFKNFSSNLNFEDFDKLSEYQSKLESDNIQNFISTDDAINSNAEESNGFRNIDFEQDFDLEQKTGFNLFNSDVDSQDKTGSDYDYNSLNDVEEEEINDEKSPYEEINVFKLKNLKKSNKKDFDYDEDYDYRYDDLDDEDSDSDDDLEIFSNLWG